MNKDRLESFQLKKIRQCHPLPFPLQPHPRSLNYIPSNLVCPWILIHPFQTRLSTLTISPRNLILTLHAHLDFFFILDCLVIGCTADGRFIRIGFPPISILTHFSSLQISPTLQYLDVLFAAFFRLFHVTDHSFLNSKHLLDTKPDFNVGLVFESSAVCLLPTNRPPDLFDPQIPTFLNTSTIDVLMITK